MVQEAPKFPVDPLAKQVNSAELYATFQVLAQPMMAQSNTKFVVPMKPIVNMVTTRVKDFT